MLGGLQEQMSCILNKTENGKQCLEPTIGVETNGNDPLLTSLDQSL